MTRFIGMWVMFLWACGTLSAQENNRKINVSGNIQSDILVPQTDQKIGAEKTGDDILTNTYAEVNATSKYVDGGIRMEYLAHPLPGFESDFKGWGVPYFHLKGRYQTAELTLGSFYEQFGSGFYPPHLRRAQLGYRQFTSGRASFMAPVQRCQTQNAVRTTT